MEQTSIYIEEEALQKVKELAKHKKVRPSVIIRWAIDQYLESLFLPACPTDSQNNYSQDKTKTA